MPKASPLQPSFSAGEFGPKVFGRSDSERHKQGLATCLNYLPTIQGPLVRRPAFMYAADAKDPSKPPALLDFKFSQTQNYILEFGDRYIRFFTNEAQILTNSTHFKVAGNVGTAYISFNSSNFYAMRSSPIPAPGETILASSVIAANSILEIESPYRHPDVHGLKYAQKNDTLFIVCSSYPEYKLQRLGNTQWDLKKVIYEDGPYLKVNSYLSPGDNARVSIVTDLGAFAVAPDGSPTYTIRTHPRKNITNAADNGSGLIRITAVGHERVTGDKVVINGVAGTVEANNGTSSISVMSWPIIKVDNDNFDLVGSTFTNAFSGSSGLVYPALFEPLGAAPNFNDLGRPVGLINVGGGRSWGTITRVHTPARAEVHVNIENSGAIFGTGSSIHTSWFLGAFNPIAGYPNAIAFHQDRKFLGGVPKYPQDIYGSMSSEYEHFATSGSSLIVSDNNALSFTLNSEQLNATHWLKSDTQGLLAGSTNSEWNISPSTQGGPITPTNIDARQTSFYGSHDTDAVQTGNATLYVQGGQRRVRELNYFFQVNTYRSTDMSELSDHITGPGLAKICVQKETIPAVWGLRTDGRLVSMNYGRDDATLKVGWARHRLGGQSDSGGSEPIVKSMAVIPSSDGTFDRLWIANQRFINGTSVLTIEYSAKPFDDETIVSDAKFFDCGGTYDSPITITGITRAGSAIVTAASHGLADGDQIRIDEVIGMNSSFIDVNGVVFNSNLVNANTFRVASTSANAFFLTDINNGSSYIDSRSYSAYVSGGEARKLVSTISGITWLKTETVSVLTDGGIHPVATVNSAGVMALQWKAARVQLGYDYNSDGKTLRLDAGSGDGSAIGKIRKPSKAAFMLHNVGQLSIGTNFNRLTPLEFNDDNLAQADQATPLFSGIKREGLEAEYDFDGQICFRQNGGLPGMVQTITPILEENDV